MMVPSSSPVIENAGLSGAEAARRLAKFGPNLFRDRRERSLPLQFLSRFANPLVILLLVASGISALTGDVTNFLIIGFMVLFSVTLDFVQEHRAGKAAASLMVTVSVRAAVVRDGIPVEIPIADMVPGDLVVLSAGDMIPADGQVLAANDFFVKQALLTGELYPIEKLASAPAVGAAKVLGAINMAFMGTTVVSGSACFRVTATGTGTAIGTIAGSLARQAPQTAFEVGTHQFGLLVLLVLLVNAFLHRPWLESFLFAVALVVGLTPELLPMVVSLTLSRGAYTWRRSG